MWGQVLWRLGECLVRGIACDAQIACFRLSGARVHCSFLVTFSLLRMVLIAHNSCTMGGEGGVTSHEDSDFRVDGVQCGDEGGGIECGVIECGGVAGDRVTGGTSEG